ncbi:hypothetical protein ACFQXB_07645 [Plastorhodobacter daqingensis]|uniref:Uncharacterized protein n=1 Tax=Plastorhodobacter daqingensis TaxID=1387281 RepID=A0ABW2UJD8_9RHOB
MAPDDPRLFRFIEFCQDPIGGPLRRVHFSHRRMIGPGEWQPRARPAARRP